MRSAFPPLALALLALLAPVASASLPVEDDDGGSCVSMSSSGSVSVSLQNCLSAGPEELEAWVREMCGHHVCGEEMVLPA